MRVLYVSSSYSPHDYRFLEGLARTPHSIGYLAMDNGRNRSEAREVPPQIRVLHDWSGRQEGNEAKKRMTLEHTIEAFAPDLVHAGPIQEGAYLTARAGFSPLLSMSWGSDLLMDARRGQGRQRAQYTLQRSTYMACDCEAVRQRAVELGMAEDRITVFPWGIDLGHFTPTEASRLRAELGWGDCIILISTRSWEPKYGVEVLIQGFIKALDSNPSLRLVMLGSGSLAERLKATLKDADCLERVVFPGHIGFKDLPGYYQLADLYITASISDGSSISLLEAMATGLPAILTDIPGNREWIEDPENGWLFPVNDADQLAEKIITACSQVERWPEMGVQNRAIVEDRADWEVNFPKLLTAYDVAFKHE